MAHVVLIRPLCEGDEPEFAEPLGIERLAGYLLEHEVAHVTVMDRRLYQREHREGKAGPGFWAHMRTQCEQDPPDVVGLSLMTAADVPDALRIIARVRGLWPKAHLVAGGWYVTTNYAEARVRLPQAVMLMEGEGEEALLTVVRTVGATRLQARCGNVPQKEAAPGALVMPDGAALGAAVVRSARVGAMRSQGTEGAQTIRRHAHDLSVCKVHPLTPDGWARAYRPWLVRYARLGCAVNMQTSRGCPGGCTFCATPNLPSGMRRWQPRSIALVVDEMEAEAVRLLHAGLPPIFNLVDDDFGPLSRVEALADELERRHLHLAFALEMRLAALIGQPRLRERLVRLHALGLTRVFVGVESLDPATLKRWHKPYEVSALPDVVTACAQARITLQPGYILWHEHQSVQRALSEVEALAAMGIYSHRVALSRLIVFPGCSLYEGSGMQEARGAGLAHSSEDLGGGYTRDAWSCEPIGEMDGQAIRSEAKPAARTAGRGRRVQGAYSQEDTSHFTSAPKHRVTHEGYQSMSPDAERFYQRLTEAMGHLSAVWTAAAIAEPYSAAQAYLTGDDTNHTAIRRTLERVNEQSLQLFRRLAQEEVRQ